LFCDHQNRVLSIGSSLHLVWRRINEAIVNNFIAGSGGIFKKEKSGRRLA
jgi:hypothetical protein